MDNNDGFVERLKKIREALNLNQKEFSSQLNISEASYSDFENGKHKPKYGFLYTLARKLNVNLYYLMFGEGEMFLDPAGSVFKNMGNILVNREEVSRFLWYFERSPLVQFSTMSNFRSILRREKETIEQEAAEYLPNGNGQSDT